MRAITELHCDQCARSPSCMQKKKETVQEHSVSAPTRVRVAIACTYANERRNGTFAATMCASLARRASPSGVGHSRVVDTSHFTAFAILVAQSRRRRVSDPSAAQSLSCSVIERCIGARRNGCVIAMYVD